MASRASIIEIDTTGVVAIPKKRKTDEAEDKLASVEKLSAKLRKGVKELQKLNEARKVHEQQLAAWAAEIASILNNEETNNPRVPKSVEVEKNNVKRVNGPIPSLEVKAPAKTSCSSVNVPVSNVTITANLKCELCARFVAETELILQQHKRLCLSRLIGEDWY